MSIASATRSSKLKILIPVLVAIFFSLSMWNWYDIAIFENWARISRDIKLYKLYEVPLILNNMSYRVVYPPIPPIIYIATRWLADVVVNAVSLANQMIPGVEHALMSVTDYVIRAIIKLPLFFFTIALAILLSRKCGSEAFYWAIAGVPTIVTLANYQFDPVVAFSLYIAVVGLDIPRVGIYISSLATSLVVLTKPLAALPLLPLLYYIYRERGLRGFILYISIASTAALAIILPFFLANPYAFIYNIVLFHSQRPPQYMSIWNIPVLLSNRDPGVVELVNVVWLPATLLLLVGTFALLLKKSMVRSRDGVIVSTLILTIIVLVFNKVVNPNYLLWAYPFIVHITLNRNLKYRRGLISYNIAATLSTLWGGLYMLIPALVNGVVIIEETGELLPARELLYRSLDTPLNETVQGIINLGEKYYKYAKMVESYTNAVGAILIAAYSIVMFMLAINLLKNSELQHNTNIST